MHQGDDADNQQARDQEPDPDKHDRFDHEKRLLNDINFILTQNATAGRALLARAPVNLNRKEANSE
jgi:hypothetical protein